MKKSILIFIVTTLLLVTLVLWMVNTKEPMDLTEILMIAVAAILAGFAIFTGVSRIKSLVKNEPPEDELSKKMMVKASSLSFFISIYLWLVIMYISDKTMLATHSLIGAGIAGMALVFFLCWLFLKIRGLKNG